MSQRYWLISEEEGGWPYEWCCRQWVTYIKRGIKHRGDPRYLEISYETLVEQPVETVKVITDFLGLKAMSKKALMSYYKRKDSDKHKDHPNVRAPPKKENITKWANKMTKRDIETFNRICKSTEDKVKKRYIKGGN